MLNRKLTPGSILTLILPVVMMILLVTGCGTDRTSITGGVDYANSVNYANNDSEFRYPELTPELLATGPAPGYHFLPMNLAANNNLDSGNPCDSASASAACESNHDKTIKIDHFVEIKIQRPALMQNIVVTIVAPSKCIAVADFYPHPYQFNGMVQITWKVKDMGLPEDFDRSTLVPWYVNDAGEYVPVDYEWKGHFDELIVRTDHFSRYIISQRVD